MTDVLVAGGGPAGLATAIGAALAGFDTLVVEPKPGVIDKACGEGLMPPAVAALEALGVRPAGHPFDGIRYVDGSRQVDAWFRQGPGLGVRRTTLHESLRLRAEQVGVRWLMGKVGDVEAGADGVDATVSTTAGEPALVHSTYLVAADGLHSAMRRRLGLGLPPRHQPRYGVRRHFAMAPWSDFVEVHWSPRAEAYVTPVSDDCVGVSILFRGKGSFEEWLPWFPALQRRLVNPCSAAMGGGPFEQRTRTRVSGPILLVGDAAGFLDPLTGEGLRLGVLAADSVVKCLRDGRIDRYDAEWRKMTAHYWTMTGGLLWLMGVPPLRRAMVPFLQAFPGLFEWGLHYLMA